MSSWTTNVISNFIDSQKGIILVKYENLIRVNSNNGPSTSFEYDGNKKHNNSNNGPSTSFEYKENKEHYNNSNNGPGTPFDYTDHIKMNSFDLIEHENDNNSNSGPSTPFECAKHRNFHSRFAPILQFCNKFFEI